MTKTVVDQEGWYDTEPYEAPVLRCYYVCSACDETFQDAETASRHVVHVHNAAASYSDQYYVAGYVHHDAEGWHEPITHEEVTYEEVWVDDPDVITGHVCSECGAKID